MIFSSFPRWAQAVLLSEGWRRRGIALACGAAGGLALPPFNFFPALIVTMTCAVWLLDSMPAKGGSVAISAGLKQAWRAGIDGWWLGFGYFVAGLWWLGSAFLVEAEEFLWALPLGVVGLPAVLALFTGIGFALAKALWSSSPGRIFALAAGVGASEVLRGVLFTGFPWNNFGMTLGSSEFSAQAASLVGVHGLTFLAVAIAATPAVMADRRRRLLGWPLAGALLYLALMVAGAVRLHVSEPRSNPAIAVRIMQPNVPQAQRFGADVMRETLDSYVDLSSLKTAARPEGLAAVTHLIWPESAFPGIVSRDPEALRRIGELLPARTTLVTGAARLETSGPDQARREFFNSIHVIQSGGAILDTYDKVHLVPFGEYLPLRRFLDRLGLRQFIVVPGGFQFGSRNDLLRVPGLGSVAPLICYEVIFPGLSHRIESRSRPTALVNVTNDGWFGRTTGPHQHFAQARLRAIEEGLPLIRAANSGISAIVDPYGRIVASLELGAAGVVDGALPLAASPTLFSRFPWTAPGILFFTFVVAAAVARRRAA